jgi:hypothetical protein
MSSPERPSPSILERIHMSRKTLGVSMQEFGNAISGFAATNDAEGVVRLSIALYQWEWRQPESQIVYK